MSILLILFCPSLGRSQLVDHWEAIILAENEWKYQVGVSEPPVSWIETDFDDSSWLTGPGGIGYGDDDDSTIIDPTYSVYLRKEFNIVDTSLISVLSLYADYDDAFVAYLNGIEICRANIGIVGIAPAYNEPADTDREANLYRGGLPEVFPIAKSSLNNGNNILAVQVHNISIASSDLSSLIFLLAGIVDNSKNYQPVPIWFKDVFKSSNLPIFVINTGGQAIVDDPKITANLGIIDNGEGIPNILTKNYNGYNGKIGIEIRGASSMEFPKKSYGFETRLEDGENNNVSLLGLPKENDWILYAPYSDKSLMRNVLSFHIGRLTGEYATRTRWCELIIDGDYRGIYVLMEKIKRDKNRVDISKVEAKDTTGIDLTGGYIFSIDRREEGGWLSPYHTQPFYRYRYPKYNDIAPQQKAYLENHITQFEGAVDTSSSSEGYASYIDIPSFLNYWIATEIFKHLDNYKFSFFMYKTRDDKGGKIHFGPLWDLNLAYGNFDSYQDPGPEGWSYVWAKLPYLRPSWIINLSEDPYIQEQIICRWNELRQDKLRTYKLFNFIDDNAALLEEAQVRNFNKWKILGKYVWPNNFIGQSYEEEVNYLKTWLCDRLAWIDDNITDYCDVSRTLSEGDSFIPSGYKLYQNYPNPFNPTTTISYDIPSTTYVRVDIFDLLGNRVSTLFSGYQEAGSYSMKFSSGGLTSGVYFYRLRTDNWTETKKMLYIK